MSRYINDVRLDQPIDVVSVLLEDFIYHNRFSRTDWNGEMVYRLKDSHGVERYMKWFYADGVFHVEAWLKGRLAVKWIWPVWEAEPAGGSFVRRWKGWPSV